MTNRGAFPGVLGEIADVAGEAAALAIAEQRGGTQIYFPPVPAEDHWLCALIGREAAVKVCDRLTCGVGPLRVDLPLGPTGTERRSRAQIDELLAQNKSERYIAQATGYTIRTVRRRRARLGRSRDDRQLSLI